VVQIEFVFTTKARRTQRKEERTGGGQACMVLDDFDIFPALKNSCAEGLASGRF
jgi:hypothetical protein